MPFGPPEQTQRPVIRREQTLGQIISQYNEYGSKLRGGISMRELAEELMQLAEFAEQAVMSEADDWFDGHTIKRNMKELKTYVTQFHKIATEQDMLRQRSTALYDDMGRVLERYFELQGDEEFKYDTDGDGLPDLQPGNAPKNPVDGAHASPMVHEDDEEPVGQNDDLVDTQQEKNKELISRLLRIARHKLTGEQLVRFDTLPEETQVKAAWRIVR